MKPQHAFWRKRSQLYLLLSVLQPHDCLNVDQYIYIIEIQITKTLQILSLLDILAKHEFLFLILRVSHRYFDQREYNKKMKHDLRDLGLLQYQLLDRRQLSEI